MSLILWKCLNNNFSDSNDVRLEIPSNLKNNYSYIGYALLGTLTSEPFWSCMRVTYDSNGNPSRYQTADKIAWDSRATAVWR